MKKEMEKKKEHHKEMMKKEHHKKEMKHEKKEMHKGRGRHMSTKGCM